MARVIRGNDTVRGTDVTFYLTFPNAEGKMERHDFIHAKNWETTAELNKEDVPRIGTRVVGKKNGTIAYSGSCNVYYMDSSLRKIFMNYVESGQWPDITAVVINNDIDSGAGENVAIHRGIKFDSIVLSKFDAESTMLDEDLDFTFESITYPSDHTFRIIDDIDGEESPGYYSSDTYE